ncbi:hypothetical protein UlMin_027556 [Ulmus minor]
MTLSSNSCVIPIKSFVHGQSLLPSSKSHQTFLPTYPNNKSKTVHPIVAVYAAEPAKNPIISEKPQNLTTSSSSSKLVDSWRSKKALQLPKYPNQEELESVLKTIELFPPIVFAGEARSLENFKEFNANNICDTFRILLQMGVVLMSGGQMPIIKFLNSLSYLIILWVGRMVSQFSKPRSDPFVEKNGVKLPSYSKDNINGDDFDLKSRTPNPQRMIRAYCQSAATLNLLRAFAIGGYAAMQRVTQWNMDFTEHSEQGDSILKLHFRCMKIGGYLTSDHLTMSGQVPLASMDMEGAMFLGNKVSKAPKIQRLGLLFCIILLEIHDGIRTYSLLCFLFLFSSLEKKIALDSLKGSYKSFCVQYPI